MAVIITWKKEGLSMGELLKSLPINTPATYAGRLDPLATGVCIVLSGSDRHHKQEFLDLDKEYIVEIVFGIGTDTLDPLGIITAINPKSITAENIQAHFLSLTPRYSQQPPRYSSIPIDGQPSFSHAKKKTNKAPNARLVQISKIELLAMHQLSTTNLVHESLERIGQVKGDFRQEEIKKSWKEMIKNLAPELSVCKLRVTCGSGTYMRSLARDLGMKLDTPALALRITRTRVGQFSLPFAE